MVRRANPGEQKKRREWGERELGFWGAKGRICSDSRDREELAGSRELESILSGGGYQREGEACWWRKKNSGKPCCGLPGKAILSLVCPCFLIFCFTPLLISECCLLFAVDVKGHGVCFDWICLFMYDALLHLSSVLVFLFSWKWLVPHWVWFGCSDDYIVDFFNSSHQLATRSSFMKRDVAQ